MGKRGRVSAADRELQINIGLDEAVYPDPPKSLIGKDERELWVQTVHSCPEGHFKPHHYSSLENFCSHVIRCRKLMMLIHFQEEAINATANGMASPHAFVFEEYLKLLTALQRQSNAASTLAVKMRINQQSEYDVRGVNKAHDPKIEEKLWAN